MPILARLKKCMVLWKREKNCLTNFGLRVTFFLVFRWFFSWRVTNSRAFLFYFGSYKLFFSFSREIFFFQKENKPKKNFAKNEKKVKKWEENQRVIARRISKKSKWKSRFLLTNWNKMIVYIIRKAYPLLSEDWE